MAYPPQQPLMAKVYDADATRESVARAYAAHLSVPGINWRAVNQAILRRWQPSGLEWIKDRAWKIAGKGPLY